MSGEDLNQKLDRLRDQGALTDEELARLRGTRPESPPAPEQPPQAESKNTKWLRVLLVVMALSGAAKSCQVWQKTRERNEWMGKAQQRPGIDRPQFGVWEGTGFKSSAPADNRKVGGSSVTIAPQPAVPRGPSVEEVEKQMKYNRIETGMTLPEVEAILGPAAETQKEDVRQSDGTTVGQVTTATWPWLKRAGELPAIEGLPQQPAELWLRVRFKDGKVAGKTQFRRKQPK